MQLVINTYGSYLRRSGDCFLVRNEGNKFEISARKIKSIMITVHAYVSTSALKLAVENNIDVILLDEFGNPYGRVWHSKLGSTALIRRRQLAISAGDEGLKLVKEWISVKLENQVNFLRRLNKNRPQKTDKILRAASDILTAKRRLAAISGTVDEKRATIMATEGFAGKIYLGALSYIMPERFKFKCRSRNPAQDEFNASLNYGYGVLYSHVERACIIAGLDPYIGFLHTDSYNKQSLVFDLIEMWRIYAEEPVVYLFSGRKIKAHFFDKVKGGLTLNKEGKALLIGALNTFFDETVRYKGRNIQRRNVIQFECHRIASGLLKC